MIVVDGGHIVDLCGGYLMALCSAYGTHETKQSNSHYRDRQVHSLTSITSGLIYTRYYTTDKSRVLNLDRSAGASFNIKLRILHVARNLT